MPCLGLLHWFINFVSGPAPLSYLWAHLALVLPLAAAHVVVGEAHVAPHRAHLDREHLTLAADIQISAANRLVGEVVQSRRRPLLGPSPG